MADIDAALLGLHLVGQHAVHRIVTQEMGIGLHRAEIVDGDDLDVAAIVLDDRAQDQTSDAPEAVDGDTYSHALLLPSLVSRSPKNM